MATHVFPAVFRSAVYAEVAERYRPQLVLGVGQYDGGEHARVESTARNAYRLHAGEDLQPIDPGGPPLIRTTIALPDDPVSVCSDDAGDHACNYSYYLFLRAAAATGGGALFLHIPSAMPLSAAMRFVGRSIDQLLRQEADRTR
jgi:pyrrolidone-carboxylate peptidase